MEIIPTELFYALPVVLAVLLVITIVVKGYVKASTDVAYIITGFRKNVRYIIGQSAIMIPFLEKKDELTLKLIQVDIRTDSAVPTQEFINLRVDGVANVKIDKRPELLERAAQNFLNKKESEIASIAQQVLEGNMREIIGQMKLTELVHNRDVFAQKVQEATEDELGKMGLVVVNLTIQNFVDDGNVIENLGIDNIVKIQKTAAIAKAESVRDIAIAQSETDKQANDARILAETEIAQKNTELEVKKSQLKENAEKERAKADIAYQIAAEKARKDLEIERENAEIAKVEKQSERLQLEVQMTARKLESDVAKVAEAEKYKESQEAEAKVFAARKEAEAKQAIAEAEKISRQLEADAAAYSITTEAKALKLKAEAVRELGLAEAEVLKEKAEAQNTLNQQALAQQMINLLPEMMGKLSEPLNNVDSITMYGEGNISQFMGDQVKSMEAMFNGIKSATGVDLGQIISGKAIGEATGKSLAEGLKEDEKGE